MKITVKKLPKKDLEVLPNGEIISSYGVYENGVLFVKRDTYKNAVATAKKLREIYKGGHEKPTKKQKNKYNTVESKRKSFEKKGWKIKSILGYKNDSKSIIGYEAVKGRTVVRATSLTALFKRL